MAGIRFEYAFVGGQTQVEWLMNFWKARNAANADGSFKCERGGGGGWDEKEMRRRVSKLNTFILKYQFHELYEKWNS